MVHRKRRQLVPADHEVACWGGAVNPACRMLSRICLESIHGNRTAVMFVAAMAASVLEKGFGTDVCI